MNMMPTDADLERAADYVRTARRLVVFTGAGVSAESGIETFRDDGGLWTEFPPARFATWHGLLRTAVWRPRQLAAFLRQVLGPLAAARPNAAHFALARAEDDLHVTIITQNIDGLHQDAGSSVVYEIHGSLLEVVTHRRRRFIRLLTRAELTRIVQWLDRAGQRWFVLPAVLRAIRPLAGFGRRGVERPSAVLFGESLHEPDWSRARAASRVCDVMLVIGTSGVVLPAAMLPAEARATGARVIVVDPDEPGTCDVWLRGGAATIVPMLFDRAFGAPHAAC